MTNVTNQTNAKVKIKKKKIVLKIVSEIKFKEKKHTQIRRQKTIRYLFLVLSFFYSVICYF